MAGLVPIGESQAAGDLTTAANIRRSSAESQAAVDERVAIRVPQEIAKDPSLIATAQAAVSDAVAGMNLMEVTRGNVPNGADLDTYFGTAFAGTWRLAAGSSTYVNLPSSVADDAVLEVTGTTVNFASTQTVTSANETLTRKVISSSGGVAQWGEWRRLTSEREVPIGYAAQSILDLAESDGWLAVYDPTNRKTRTERIDRITAISDGLGNLPPITSSSNSRAPRYAENGFGRLDAGNYGVGGATELSTPDLTGYTQPIFVLMLAQTRITSDAFTRHALDTVNTDRIGIAMGSTGNAVLTGGSNKNVTGFKFDNDNHLFGALFNGDDSRAFIDGQEMQLSPVTDPAFSSSMGGLRVGNRYAGGSFYWEGLIGPVLIFEGVPSDDVRERMSRLLLALSNPAGVLETNLNSSSAVLRTESGALLFNKAADVLQIPASTIKMVTGYTVRQTISNARLDEIVTIQAGDLTTTSLPRLYEGDQLTYRDLLYLAMLPSHNVACRILARAVGDQLTGTGTGMQKFVAKMQANMDNWGWEGAVAVEPTGLNTGNRLSANMIAELLFRIRDEDTLLLNIMGTLTHEISVGGADARSITAKHTIDPNRDPGFPEFIAGKTGTLSLSSLRLGNVGMLVDHPDGVRAVVTLGADPQSARYTDARRVMDGEAVTIRTVGGVQTDNGLSQTLNDPGSLGRHILDALYAERIRDTGQFDISDMFPDIDLSAQGSRVTIQRIGSEVELLVAAASLPPGFDHTGVIPAGFRPGSFAYGSVSRNHTDGDAGVQVNSNGRFILRGNSVGDLLRGTVKWFTSEPFPVVDPG